MKQNSAEQTLTKTIIRLIKEKNPENVDNLADLVAEETSFQKEQIIEHILSLQNQGKIKLKRIRQKPPVNLREYLRTSEANWYWATLIFVIITAITVFSIPEDRVPLVYVRYVLGTIFVLWLPGYSFVRALFPKISSIAKFERSLDSVERLALSIGTSLALVAIIGLLLNYTPWGIRQTPILISLSLLTSTFATAAIIQEHNATLTK